MDSNEAFEKTMFTQAEHDKLISLGFELDADSFPFEHFERRYPDFFIVIFKDFTEGENGATQDENHVVFVCNSYNEHVDREREYFSLNDLLAAELPINEYFADLE